MKLVGHAERSRLVNSAAKLTFLLADIAIIVLSTYLAYFTRFSGMVAERFLPNVAPVAIVGCLLFPVLFWAFRLYNHVWRYVSIDVLVKLAVSVAMGFAIMLGLNLVLTEPGVARIVPNGVLVIMAMFIFIGSATLRTFGRILSYLQSQSGGPALRSVLIIGAGDAASLLLRDIENQPELRMRVVGLLDDDPLKQGRFIRSTRVLGPIAALPSIVEQKNVDEIFVAAPSATPEDRSRILNICTQVDRQTRIMRTLAGDAQLHGVADLRKVSIEDLLGRRPVVIDVDSIRQTIKGKTIAVTGAAGSIGSELCRQVLKMEPGRLLLLDIDESRLYEMYLELDQTQPGTSIMHICDVRDFRKVNAIFDAERPHIVLHTAAYKHVPLMELAPDEAVKANILGTRNVIRACEENSIAHFVLISTDKAVAPSSVMGATKAVAERLMLDASRRGRLKASAVRFGNVLGSRGSVVPIFEEQLQRGGPLRVTHPDVTRYFMTIPEAARLVLQAQAMSVGGEIFVLEMGVPVRIVDLARKMIALSGSSAQIEFSGLRPAEKMHEVLVHGQEELLETDHDEVLRINCLPVPPRDFETRIDRMVDAALEGDTATALELLRSAVADYSPESGSAKS